MRNAHMALAITTLLASGCGESGSHSREDVEPGFNVEGGQGAVASDNSGSDRVELDGSESMSFSQLNAVRTARQYLAMSGFSRDGLIEQLSSDAGEGYPIEDATIAVDSLNVDWNENAAKSARQYVSMMGFSCQGLIEQLSSSAGEKYTTEQARYGAQQAGLC